MPNVSKILKAYILDAAEKLAKNQWRHGMDDDRYHTYHTIERSRRLHVLSKVDQGFVDYWDTV